ncbi:MAG: glycosyltransferase family 2 protein [bacterium]|nr:glycosyltransferase family 2 protein [bacterium]
MSENRMLSLVVPIFNERENVRELHEELVAVLSDEFEAFEILYVDDGSTDGTTALLEELVAGEERARLVVLRRNYGQTAAFAAGFEHARGEMVVTMDGDLQNDPADISRLLAEFDRGYDVVSGWRVERRDNLARRLPSVIANRLISAVTGVKLHDYGCSLKIYRSEILRDVRLYGEMHRFLPALCAWQGASVTEVATRHRPRIRGTSKYGLGRTLRVIMDLLTVKFLMTFSTRPLHVFGILGLGSFACGMAINLYLSFQKLALGMAIGGRPLLLLGVLLLFTGFQFISFGLLGEMLARIYHESQKKPIYQVRRVVSGGGEP